MRTPKFSGIGGHHSATAQTVEWLTPPYVIEALGGWESFDLDPATPFEQPYPTALRRYTQAQDGLMQRWDGRVWLNPPYTTKELLKWLGRMAEHDHGTALIFARTETDAFHRFVWEQAAAVLFLRGRLNFHLPDGTRAKANAGGPSVLCAYGMSDADILAGCEIAGQFVPLKIPRSVLVEAVTGSTWREVLAGYFANREGPVRLDELYRAFADHPKAKGNNNIEAKLRQELQRGPYRRVQRGLWEMENEQ